jgi:HAD superfamily hydrolase (TIGR01458 family)
LIAASVWIASMRSSAGLAPHYLVHPDLAEDMGPSDLAPTAVVMGDAGPYFTFERLNAAFRLLMDGLPLIAMARNRYFKEADGLTLDLGAFVAALEFAAGVRAEIVGKPAAAFFHGALAELGVAPAEAVLIGDDVADDIGGAQDAGIAGILVRTGKYRAGDEDEARVRPAAVADDFAAAVDLLLGA